MFKLAKRNLALVLVLSLLPLAAAHADGTTPPATSPSSVTGGSPEPTSPTAVQIILSLLHLT